MVRIIGHRGAMGYAPENTLESFKKAIELGCDAIELDVRLSKDGQLVVIHDAKVNRTTNGKGLVSEKTLKELKVMVEQFCDKHLLDCPNFRQRVAVGDPGEEIVKTVEKEKIDLVIMGTHGRKGLEHTLFGTVAHYVVTHSKAPVLIINPYRVEAR